ncbi:hypothetical protein GDO78_009618 [Eleutherodactylus coqui]|uniref:Uncharacterized protein n=1 Tax=Eleutherodactylus coqui TaxID=57060 RepID=A0A8J6FA02_ELECQ|nr:hypothetical protein GDO78_009618 [Eleutherodactylus coqui]
MRTTSLYIVLRDLVLHLKSEFLTAQPLLQQKHLTLPPPTPHVAPNTEGLFFLTLALYNLLYLIYLHFHLSPLAYTNKKELHQFLMWTLLTSQQFRMPVHHK